MNINTTMSDSAPSNSSANTCKINRVVARKTPTKRKRRLCQVEGCERTVKSQRLCQRHGAKPRSCKVNGYTKQAQGSFRGMCKLHFKSLQTSAEEAKSVTDIDSVDTEVKRIPAHPFAFTSALPFCGEVRPAAAAAEPQGSTFTPPDYASLYPVPCTSSSMTTREQASSYVNNALSAARNSSAEITHADRVANLLYQHSQQQQQQEAQEESSSNSQAVADAAQTLAAMANNMQNDVTNDILRMCETNDILRMCQTNNVLRMILLAYILNQE